MASMPALTSLRSTRPKPSSLRQMRSATLSQFNQLNSIPEAKQDLRGLAPDSRAPPSPPSSQPSALTRLSLSLSHLAAPQHAPLAGPSTSLPDVSNHSFLGAPDGQEQTGDEDDGGSETTMMAEDYDRPQSPLDPSPVGKILFSSQDHDYDTLSHSQASEIEGFFCPAVPSIGAVLVGYRKTVDKWEQAEEPALSVIKASIVVDQCLLKVFNVLEHAKIILDMLYNLSSSLESFCTGLHPSQLERQNEYAGARFWHALTGLADQVKLLEDALSGVSLEFRELCEWLDGHLTPVLAELKPASADANQEVGRILDEHSYLCEAMSQTTGMVQIMTHCAKKIGQSVESFQRLFYADGKALEAGVLQKWAGSWNQSLEPIIISLGLLVAISDHIQSSTAGTPHAIYV